MNQGFGGIIKSAYFVTISVCFYCQFALFLVAYYQLVLQKTKEMQQNNALLVC